MNCVLDRRGDVQPVSPVGMAVCDAGRGVCTGRAEGGENLFINGDHFDQLRRVLVYAFIYQGVPNWAATDAVVTIEIAGQPTVEVRLDSGTREPMCAIAMLENQGGRLQVTKLVEYFGGDVKMSAHQAMDERFGFGLNWKRGSKN